MNNVQKDIQVVVGVGVILTVIQIAIAATSQYFNLSPPKTMFSVEIKNPAVIMIFGVFALVCEELLFRVLPLWLSAKYKIQTRWVVIIGLVSSISFALLHGFTLSAVLIQGTWGAAVFYTGFLVMNSRGILHAAVVCIFLHMFINLVSLGSRALLTSLV